MATIFLQRGVMALMLVMYDDASNLEREQNGDLDAGSGGDNLVATSRVIECDDESSKKN